MLIHRVNNIEHNIKLNVYNDMEVISLIPHDIVYKTSTNGNVVTNQHNVKYKLFHLNSL